MIVALASGCSNPASLKITLTALEPTLATVEVEVRPAGAMMSSDVLDCRFQKGMRMGTKCTLEASKMDWGGCHGQAPCDPLTFIVYGSPKTKLTVAATGFAADGTAVTSASDTLTLPSNGAETATVVTLPAAHVGECETTLATRYTTPGEAFIAPVPSASSPGKLDLYAVSSGTSSLLSYDPKPSGATPCTLTKIAEAPACAIAQFFGSVVIGNVSGTADLESIAMCIVPGTLQFSIAVAPLMPTASNNLSNTTLKLVLAPRVMASLPVLADLDGDGKKEIVFLFQAEGNTELSLKVWFPDMVGTSSVTTIPITGILNLLTTTNIPIGPLVYPVDSTHDGLVISGYANGFATYDRTAGLQVVHTAGARAFRSDWGTSLLKRMDGTISFVERVRFLPNAMPDPRIEMDFVDLGQRNAYRTDYPITMVPQTGFPASRSTRPALGDVAGDGTKTAVIGEGPNLYLFPIVPGVMSTARAIALTDQSLIGGMIVLLANIDKKPGLEMIAYNPASPQLFAVDKNGTALPGFPLSVSSGTAPLRAVLADLDGDGSSEIIALQLEALKVYSLGAGSYDKTATPWPMHFRDLRSSAGEISESDPLR